MKEVTIPLLGVGMEEALLIRWHKQPGDAVEPGDVVAEIETDKSTFDLESPASGHLGEHLYEAGALIPVMHPIVQVIEAGDDGHQEATGALPAVDTVLDPPASAPEETAPPDAGRATVRESNRLSPRARRRALESSDDRATLDIEAADAGDFRAIIAASVTSSWNSIPHFSVTREFDASRFIAVHTQIKNMVPEATLTDLLARAIASALVLERGAKDDIGLAVDTSRGVVVPVLRGIAKAHPAEITRQRMAAVSRARGGALTRDDVSIPPIATLSNLGGLGVDHFTGIIPIGQQMLLTIGRIRARPTVTSGRVEARPSLIATLIVDHRALDGADAARILAAFGTALDETDVYGDDRP